MVYKRSLDISESNEPKSNEPIIKFNINVHEI